MAWAESTFQNFQILLKDQHVQKSKISHGAQCRNQLWMCHLFCLSPTSQSPPWKVGSADSRTDNNFSVPTQIPSVKFTMLTTAIIVWNRPHIAITQPHGIQRRRNQNIHCPWTYERSSDDIINGSINLKSEFIRVLVGNHYCLWNK